MHLRGSSERFCKVLSQIHYAEFDIAEITCPTKYVKDSSSINFMRSIKYGFGVLRTSFQFFFQKLGVIKIRIFEVN